MTHPTNYYGDEPAPGAPTLDKRTERTAAAHHACDECGGTIAAGTVYTHHAVKVDGTFHTARYHSAPCRR